ncbi:methionyl-tRNA formyltransferase [Salinigranum halophilum]|uniref:methionyl-tRNA formyltransferase n=1 Tax=Salinigranum halophilum TaxID=2565931 RepID=UPI00115F4B35|nr:formyltransferase family protein [Salinigranum halophilum]
MDVVFLGTNNYGRDIYDWLCDRDGVNVRAMLTESNQLDLISTIGPDLIVAAGFTHVVPPEVLSIPEKGCLNVHPGVLPATRGFNPNVWSIVDDLPAGATVHYMDEGIDTGDVIATRAVETSFADTGKDVYQRVERACVELFCEVWPEVEAGTVESREQDEAGENYYRKQEFIELCELDPDEQVRAVDFLNRLRALTFPPFDNARIEINGEQYYVDIDIRTAADGEDEAEDTYGTLSSY